MMLCYLACYLTSIARIVALVHVSEAQFLGSGLHIHILYIYSIWQRGHSSKLFNVFSKWEYLDQNLNFPLKQSKCKTITRIRDSPYYVFVALCIVVIVVSLIFKMAYFLSWPVQELLKKARVRCAIANNKIFVETFNIFSDITVISLVYQWYHYNHNAKRHTKT
jgi:hypothetical protein